MPERPTIGSPLRRLKHRLGFCWCCWRRWQQTADIAGYDDSGTEPVTIATRYRLCTQHTEEWTRALMSVPHTGTAEFTDGHTVGWAKEDPA